MKGGIFLIQDDGQLIEMTLHRVTELELKLDKMNAREAERAPEDRREAS